MKSRNELTQQLCARYRKAAKKEKSIILNEFIQTTGYNRSYAALKLRNYGKVKVIGQKKYTTTLKKRKKGGRKPIYTDKLKEILITLWKLFNYQCGKRLVPIIHSTMSNMGSFPLVDDKTKELLMKISPSTVDRILKPIRRELFAQKGHSYTKGTMALKDQIPIRTFGDWKGVPPGHFQIDCVGHDGGFVSGQCSFTLVITDIHSGWTERRAMVNRAAKWVVESLDLMGEHIPFPIKELHPDNGSEFINMHLVKYAQGKFQLSRSRSGKKNDNCYVEQKNFDTVRKLVGYARYSAPEAIGVMNDLYRLQGLLQNYVYPSFKLISKVRVGSRYKKKYDEPKTPAQRILESPDVHESVKKEIRKTLKRIEPVALAMEVKQLQEKLITLADKVLSVPYGKAATSQR